MSTPPEHKHYYAIVPQYDSSRLYNYTGRIFPFLQSGKLSEPDLRNLHMIVDSIDAADRVIEAYNMKQYSRIPAPFGVSKKGIRWTAIKLSAYTGKPGSFVYYNVKTHDVSCDDETEITKDIRSVCINLHYKKGILSAK
jgi:hypothetical protein